MNRKDKLVFLIIGALCAWMLGMVIWSYEPMIEDEITVDVVLESDKIQTCKLYYTFESVVDDESFSEEMVSSDDIEKQNEKVNVSFVIPSNTTQIRLDLGDETATFVIYEVSMSYKSNIVEYSLEDALDVHVFRDISAYFMNEAGEIEVATTENDPFVVWDIQKYNMQNLVQDNYQNYIVMIKAILCGIAFVFAIILWKKRSVWSGIPKDLYANKAMIWSLAKTDFQNKYSSSYFGVVWAFVQPVVTIAIYVFVFQVGFKAGDTSTGYPFLLYLVSGIVPWFFFAEAWMNATNCLVEYNYLVKKVVFKISILPIVKVIASLFVHLAFIVLALLVFVLNGKLPGIQFLQIIYYLICAFALALSLSYFTAAIIPFFRDLAQIINIITQLGMWTLPIMYDEAIIGEGIMRFLRFNPMYYVVTGYRDAFMNGQWFWERTEQTVYFWVVVMVLFAIGFKTFKKLKVHFADVL